jgi:hypothetical protein
VITLPTPVLEEAAEAPRLGNRDDEEEDVGLCGFFLFPFLL